MKGLLLLLKLARLPAERSKHTRGADSPQHLPGNLEKVAEIICFTDREMFLGEEEKDSLYRRVFGGGAMKAGLCFLHAGSRLRPENVTWCLGGSEG